MKFKLGDKIRPKKTYSSRCTCYYCKPLNIGTIATVFRVDDANCTISVIVDEHMHMCYPAKYFELVTKTIPDWEV